MATCPDFAAHYQVSAIVLKVVRWREKNTRVHNSNVLLVWFGALEPHRQTGKGWANESRDFKENRECISGTHRFYWYNPKAAG